MFWKLSKDRCGAVVADDKIFVGPECDGVGVGAVVVRTALGLAPRVLTVRNGER